MDNITLIKNIVLELKLTIKEKKNLQLPLTIPEKEILEVITDL